ncbi:dCache_2 domain-containing protein [Pseudoscourfieldia marina]
MTTIVMMSSTSNYKLLHVAALTESHDGGGDAAAAAAAKALVTSVVADVEVQGLDSVLRELNNPNSTQYRNASGASMVFVVAFNGTILSGAEFPSFVGRSVQELIDSNLQLGNLISGDEYNERSKKAAMTPGGGWMEYPWITPDGVEFTKVSYLSQPIANDVYIGSGYELPPNTTASTSPSTTTTDPEAPAPDEE